MIVPPKKGRQHVLRMIRELLAFNPRNKGTNIKLALDTVNQILKRKSIIFLISDFIAEPASYQKELAVTNKRHDLIGIDLNDPLESKIGEVGLLALEDPENGEIIWVDTASKSWQDSFVDLENRNNLEKKKIFQYANVDRISIETNQDYTLPLTKFFNERAKRFRR